MDRWRSTLMHLTPGSAFQAVPLKNFPGHGEPTRVIDIVLNAMRRSRLTFVICRCKQEPFPFQPSVKWATEAGSSASIMRNCLLSRSYPTK
jgi:hypothetical protein